MRKRSFWENEVRGLYRSDRQVLRQFGVFTRLKEHFDEPVMVSRRSLTRMAAFVGFVALASTLSKSSSPLSGVSMMFWYRARATVNCQLIML